MLAISNEIKIVIGSWGSYNECNERAYGSKWLDLADYSDWEEIEEELKAEGFELDNWDYVNPQDFFELLLEADVLDNPGKYDVMMAFIEVRGYNEFKDRVEKYGSRWDDDIHLYKNYDWEDYGRETFDNMGYEVENWILDFFDFKAYGESFQYDGDITEYSEGLIEIY